MQNCIFCKIAKKEIPTTFMYEDEEIMVFPDIHPKKPIHLLIVPKKHIEEFGKVQEHGLFARIGKVIQQMIKAKALEDKGYRVFVNGGGFQDIDHLHFHLIGPLGKPAAM